MNKVLEAIGITKNFKSPDGSKIEVLKGIDFHINAGESLSLRGESGAGKTTLLNIIAGMESASSGKLLWNNKQIDNLSNSKQALLRGKFMGFVFQNYCLVPELNALENVELALRITGNLNLDTKNQCKEILEKVGMAGRLSHLPSQLSGGEKQRVAIARAIITKPSLILADEPTGNLDEHTAKDIMYMFLDLCQSHNTAIMLITHNPDFAKLTKTSLLLKDGLLCKNS